MELLRVHRQEGRAAGDPGQVGNVDVREAGRELGHVDAADAERVGGVRAEVGLEGERLGQCVPGAQLVDEGRTEDPRVVQPGAVGRQAGVLDAGDERPEIEPRRRVSRRRQTARRLPLRRIELELAPVEADEQRVPVGRLVVNPSREDVVDHLAVDGRRVVVEIPRSVGQGIDAGDVPPDAVNAVLRDDVAGKGIAQKLRVRGADRPRGVEGRVQPRRERVVNRDQGAARAPEVTEVAGAGLRRRTVFTNTWPRVSLRPA